MVRLKSQAGPRKSKRHLLNRSTSIDTTFSGLHLNSTKAVEHPTKHKNHTLKEPKTLPFETVARVLGISVAQKYVEDLWGRCMVRGCRYIPTPLPCPRHRQILGIDSLNQGERSPESIDRTLSESELRTYTKDLQGRVDRFISELRNCQKIT